MNTEAAILAAFPGDDELHKAVRISLLRVVHAGKNASLALNDVKALVSIALADPPFGAWWRAGDVRFTTQKLLAVVAELEKADAVLADAWKNWERPEQGEAPDAADGLGRPLALRDSTVSEAGDEYPF